MNNNVTNSTTTPVVVVYTIGAQVGALAIVTFTAALVGALIGIISGFKFPKVLCFNGFEIKPMAKKFVIPALIGMIIMGVIARNTFGSVMKAWPTNWSQEIKNICLAILLIRGGLQIKLPKGSLLITICMAFIPQTLEALTIAWMANGLFGMPVAFSYAMAYIISCISPSVMVPSLITLLQNGFGKKRGVVPSLIASGTFDDIICIIIFGICKTIIYNQEGMSGGKSMTSSIGGLFAENAIGLAIGLVMGFIGYVFKYVTNKQANTYLKMIYCLGNAIFFVLSGEKLLYPNAKYIASLTFGYISLRMWGEENPSYQLGWFWFFVSPLFFGAVGASLLFKQIRRSDIFNGFACIIVGLAVRLLTLITVVSRFKIYTMKETIFMAFSWVPKATVQATLAGVILADGTAALNLTVMHWGNIIQTVSIFSIMICAPIGAILINTFGPIFLPHESEDQVIDQDPEAMNINNDKVASNPNAIELPEQQGVAE